MARGSLLEDVLVVGGLAVGGYLLWNYISTLPATTATATPAATTTTAVATTAAAPVASSTPAAVGPPSWAQGYQHGRGGGFAARQNTGGPQVTMRGRPQRIGNNTATACTFTAADGTTQNGMIVNGTCIANMSAG